METGVFLQKKVQFAPFPIIYKLNPNFTKFEDEDTSPLNVIPESDEILLKPCLKNSTYSDSFRTQIQEKPAMSIVGILIIIICLMALFGFTFYVLHMLLEIEIEKQVNENSISSSNS